MVMESHFSSIPLLSSLLLILYITVKVVKRSIGKTSTAKLPPGPWQLPLIGNLHQLLVSPLPHHVIKDLSMKYGPLMYLRLGEVPIVVASSAELAEEFLKTHGINFAQRPYNLASHIVLSGSKDIVFTPYGDYWRQMRKICTVELLSPKRIQTFQSIREEEVSNLIRDISLNEGSTVNLSKKISSMTYAITGRAAFGKKSKHQKEFIQCAEHFVDVAGGFCIADLYPSSRLLQVISGVRPKLEQIKKDADRIFGTIIDDHKEANKTIKGSSKREDLVDVLLRVQKDGALEIPLTEDNIQAVIADIFAAGSETSSRAVEWVLSELLKNPPTMKRAQAEVRKMFGERKNFDEKGLQELKYLQAVVKETLRLHPAAPLLVPRESSEQCEINGYLIPAKTRLFVNVWAIARDPRHWPEPEMFNPDRFLDSKMDYKGTNFQYIPFGAGRRICPGVSFALASIELPLAQLLYHFDWKLPNGLKQEELDMTEVFALTVRRKHDLNLIPIPYHPSPEE